MIDLDGLVLSPCMDAFAEPVLFEPVGGAPYQVVGVFDEAYLELRPNDEFAPGNITSARPVLGVRAALFTAEPLQNDVVTILRTGQVFWINEVQPDGHGHILLLLGDAP